MRSKFVFAGLVSSMFMLQGCSSMLSIGDSNYSCDGLPSGSTCSSVIEVYEDTHSMDYKNVKYEGQEVSGSEEDSYFYYSSKSVGSESSKKLVEGRQVSSLQGIEVAFGPNNHTAPKLKEVVRKRLWVAPWISKQGVNYDQQLVYLKKDAQWQDQEIKTVETIRDNSTSSRFFTPLK